MNIVAGQSELRENAELVVSVLNEKEHAQLDYSPDSISWLEAYIDQHRPQLSDDDKRILHEKFGSYLGEVIRLNYGGEWYEVDEGEWAIAFNNEPAAHPFDIVHDHLYHAESMARLYEQIPELFDRKADSN